MDNTWSVVVGAEGSMFSGVSLASSSGTHFSMSGVVLAMFGVRVVWTERRERRGVGRDRDVNGPHALM